MYSRLPRSDTTKTTSSFDYFLNAQTTTSMQIKARGSNEFGTVNNTYMID